MGKITFTTEDIQSISLFEAITGVEVKDYVLTEEAAHFLVEEGKIGKAIGKGGKTIKRVQEQLKMNVYVHEYSTDLEKFVGNLVPAPLEKLEVQERGGEKVVLITIKQRDRSKVLGRGGNMIQTIKRILRRAYNVSDVKVQT